MVDGYIPDRGRHRSRRRSRRRNTGATLGPGDGGCSLLLRGERLLLLLRLEIILQLLGRGSKGVCVVGKGLLQMHEGVWLKTLALVLTL